MTRHAARRMEAAAGAGLRGAASAAHRLSRRANVRRRSHLAPSVLGSDSPDGGGGRDRLCHHALHGGGGILQPAGAHLSRQDGRARHAVRAEAYSMKGELLLVECEPLGRAVEALQSAPDVIDAAVFGNALHLVVARCRCRGRRSSELSLGAHESPSAASSRFAPRLKMSSSRSPPRRTRRRRAKHEPYAPAGRGAQRGAADSARLAQPRHCGHHAGHAHAAVWLRRQSRSQRPARLRLRPGRQPAKPGPAQALPGQRILSHCARRRQLFRNHARAR